MTASEPNFNNLHLFNINVESTLMMFKTLEKSSYAYKKKMLSSPSMYPTCTHLRFFPWCLRSVIFFCQTPAFDSTLHISFNSKLREISFDALPRVNFAGCELKGRRWNEEAKGGTEEVPNRKYRSGVFGGQTTLDRKEDLLLVPRLKNFPIL